MKYCNECKVYAPEGLTNCPLCGSYLDKAEIPAEHYKEQDKLVSYPKLKLKGDEYKHFLRKKSLAITLTIICVCILVNAVATPDSIWSAYVAAGGLAVFLCVLTTIYRKSRFYSLLSVCGLVIPITLFCIDLIQSYNVLHSAARLSFALPYAIPGFFIALIVTLDVMVMSRKSKYKYYLSALLLTSCFALAPQIVYWSGVLDFPSWLTFSCFCFALGNGIIMSIIHVKSLAAELKRKLHI